jgi:hypothetical protein
VASPAPAPPSAAPEAALKGDLTALRADLDGAVRRAQAQAEEQAKKILELTKALEETRKALPDLAPLQEALKAAQEQLKTLLDSQAAQARARVEIERAAYPASLQALEDLQADMTVVDPLPGLAKRLGELRQAVQLQANPEFQALLATLREKLPKGPLADALRDPAPPVLANPYGAAVWTRGGCFIVGGWEKEKVANIARAWPAMDLATRMDGELRASRLLVDGLAAEAAMTLADLKASRLAAQRLADPAAEAPAALDSEAFKPKLAAFLAGLDGTPPAATLAALAALRGEIRARRAERRLLLIRMSSLVETLSSTFAPFAKEGPAKDLPAMTELAASLSRAREALKAALAPRAAEPAGTPTVP